MGTNPRHDYKSVSIGIGGEGVTYDPPAEFVKNPGVLIGERTPGWLRFVKVFQITDEAKPVKVSALLYGVGTAWVDDIETRPIKKP